MSTISPPLRVIVAEADPPPPPPPPTGGRMLYELLTPGPVYHYAFSSSHAFDSRGGLRIVGSSSHMPYALDNRNGVRRFVPPPFGQTVGAMETPLPEAGKRNWSATDEPMRTIIPRDTARGRPEIFIQDAGILGYDCDIERILWSNIAPLQTMFTVSALERQVDEAAGTDKLYPKNMIGEPVTYGTDNTGKPRVIVYDMKTDTIMQDRYASLVAALTDPTKVAAYHLNSGKLVVEPRVEPIVQDIPTVDGFIESLGATAAGILFNPYQPAHDWSPEHQCLVTICGSRAAAGMGGICITPAPDGSPYLFQKKLYRYPPNAAHPVNPAYGMPQKSINSGACFGDWLYVFGAQHPNYTLEGYSNAAPHNFRIHIPSIKACAPNAYLTAGAFEHLPPVPFMWPSPGGVGYTMQPLVRRGNGYILIIGYRVVKLVPHDDPAQFQWEDVTPDGWPTLAQWVGDYDPVSDAFYISNAYPPFNANGSLNVYNGNMQRPRVGMIWPGKNDAERLGALDPAALATLRNSAPPFVQGATIARLRFA